MSEQYYSERLGRISDGRLQAALDRFRLGRFIRAEPIPHGHFGQNLFLTSSSGEYVLRGNPYYSGQFAAERFHVEALAHGTRTPVPWPYQIDDDPAVFGWSYVVMPRMAGLRLADPAVRDGLELGHRVGIARALARNLAEMHALTWEHPGRYYPAIRAVGPLEPADASVWALPDPGPRPAEPSGAFYGRWVTDRVLARLAQAQGHNPAATTGADLAWVRSLLSAAAPAMAEPFATSLVVEDYKEGNVVVGHDDDGWRVSGVFDLAQCYFGDGESDLPRTLCSYLDEDARLARAFLDSYLALRPPRPGFARRSTAYLLLDRALLWEFFQRRGLRWWPSSWTFSDWVGRYLDLLNPLLRDSGSDG